MVACLESQDLCSIFSINPKKLNHDITMTLKSGDEVKGIAFALPAAYLPSP